MNKNDLALIEQAEKLNCIDWAKADAMAEQAESEEAKQRLISISKYLYRREEYITGIF